MSKPLRPFLDRAGSPTDRAELRSHWWRWALWFQLANALLILCIGLRSFAFGSMPGDSLGVLFLALFVPAHFTTLSFAIFPLIGAVWLLRPGPAVGIVSMLLNSVLVAVMLVDTQVFALYRFHLNSIVLSLVFSGVADEVLRFSAIAQAQAVAIALSTIGAEWLLARMIWRQISLRPRMAGRVIAAGLLAVIVAGQAMHVWADAFMASSITRQIRYLPWARAMTAHRFLSSLGWIPSEQTPIESVPFSESGIRYPLTPLSCSTNEKPGNLIIVIIEEWRWDEFDARTTPNIWRFSKRGLVFEDHLSSGNASRYGVFGLLYGLHGTYWDAVLAEQRGSILIDEALRRDYAVATFVGANLIHPEFDRTVFASVRDRITLRGSGRTPMERDEALSRSFIEFIDRSGDDPFIAFLFYDSPHSMDYPEERPVPYAPAQNWGSHLELGPEVDPAPLFNRHRNSIHYVDELVGGVLNELEDRGMLENSTIVITGDHGEEFNEFDQNYWGHNGNFGRYQTQVGFVLHLPGHAPGRIQRPTSHVDLVPTLMSEVFACTTSPEQYGNGQSLLDESGRPYRIVSGGSTGVGIIEGDRSTVIDPFGWTRVLDRSHREVEVAPDPERLTEVLHEISRFYEREP